MGVPETIVIDVPMRFRRRRGRRTIVLPDGTSQAPQLSCGGTDDPVIKALGRAYRWQQLLESGVYGTLADIAKAEKLSLSFVSRIFRMNLLAPTIVEAILDGTLPFEISLKHFAKALPPLWAEQMAVLEAAADTGT